jgi:hypothetical protein
MEWPDSSGGTIDFHYIFKFNDGTSKVFKIVLDERTLSFVHGADREKPEWARLDYCRCENCPRHEKADDDYCPVALSIAGLVEDFGDLASYENAYVLVITRERDISKNTTVHEGLSSMMGVYMVTSGCPVMERLKPMVRYHLPFATIKESVYRVISMYLLVQYFLKKKGEKPDWELKRLADMYEDIRTVNAGISMRLKSAAKKDASIAAIGSLDFLASLLPLIIGDTVQDIEDSLGSLLG